MEELKKEAPTLVCEVCGAHSLLGTAAKSGYDSDAHFTIQVLSITPGLELVYEIATLLKYYIHAKVVFKP